MSRKRKRALGVPVPPRPGAERSRACVCGRPLTWETRRYPEDGGLARREDRAACACGCTYCEITWT